MNDTPIIDFNDLQKARDAKQAAAPEPEQTDPNMPKFYNYDVTTSEGTVLQAFGFLAVTPTFVAVLQDQGEFHLMVPLGNVKSVELIYDDE